MANVFNVSEKAKSPTLIRAGRAKLSIEKGSGTMLALNCVINYQRGVEVVPVIGDNKVISVGEPQGTVSIQTVIAKGADTIQQILGQDEGCKGFTLNIDFQGDTKCDMGMKKATCYGCVASAVSVEMQGGRGYVASGVQITFTAMELG